MTAESPASIRDYMDSQERAGTTLIKKNSNEKIYCNSSGRNSALKISITESHAMGNEEE